MSIAIKKFLSMLENEISSDTSTNETQKAVLTKLCEKIYILESTNDKGQIPANIKEEIKFYAKEYES
jgi:hypothetical protein